MSNQQNINHESAARQTIIDVLKLLHGDFALHQLQIDECEPTLEGAKLADLLDQNFSKLDANDNGISQSELIEALSHRERFNEDEYSMLLLVHKYFKTIANLSDDEDGPETVITRKDAEVLSHFLRYSPVTLQDLHKWENEYTTLEGAAQDGHALELSGEKEK